MLSSSLFSMMLQTVLFCTVKFDIVSVCVVVMVGRGEKLKTDIDWSCSSVLNIHNLDGTEHWSSWFLFFDVIFLIILNFFRCLEFGWMEYHRLCLVKESIFSFNDLILSDHCWVVVCVLHCSVYWRNKMFNLFLNIYIIFRTCQFVKFSGTFFVLDKVAFELVFQDFIERLWNIFWKTQGKRCEYTCKHIPKRYTSITLLHHHCKWWFKKHHSWIHFKEETGKEKLHRFKKAFLLLDSYWWNSLCDSFVWFLTFVKLIEWCFFGLWFLSDCFT